MNLQFFYTMLPVLCFFAGVICFFIAFSSKVNKTVSRHKKKWSNYLQEDSKANFIRKKEIPSNLLLTVEIDKIPAVNDSECQLKLETLKNFKDLPMCNLSGLSNLELKQQFGYQGFQVLVEYEQTYTSFMEDLVDYGLMLNNKGYQLEAMETLEYATIKHCDKSICYLTLIEIYGIIKDRLKLEGLEDIISRNLANSVYYKDIQEKLQSGLSAMNK